MLTARTLAPAAGAGTAKRRRGEPRGRLPVVVAALVVGLMAPLLAPVLGPSAAVAQTNNAATGRPRILVEAGGLSLVADHRGISDADGLPSSGDLANGSFRWDEYSYEWFRVDPVTSARTSLGASEESEEAARYVLTDDDVGHLIEVTVTFTDNKMNAESVTSYPFGPVPDRTAPPSRPPRPLVSNLAQSNSSARTITSDYYMRFNLGHHGQGYEINSVSIDFAAAPTDLTVSLWIAGINGYPHSGDRTNKLFDFTNPDSFKAGVNTFTAPAGAWAYPNVNYYIALTGFDSLSINDTSSDAEDPGGEPKAFIHNSVSGRSEVLRMAVGGSRRDRGILASKFTHPWFLDQEIISVGDGESWGITLSGADRYLVRTFVIHGDDTTSNNPGFCNPFQMFRGSGRASSDKVTNLNPTRYLDPGLAEYTAPQGTTVSGDSYEFDQRTQSEGRECGILLRVHSSPVNGMDTPTAPGVARLTSEGPSIAIAGDMVPSAVLGEALFEMVSNVDQSNASYRVVNSTSPFVSQGFRTGPHPLGFRLSGVDVNVEGSDNADSDPTIPDDEASVRVSVWTDSGGTPGQKLFDLISPQEYGAGRRSFFEAPRNTRLEPDTSYVLVWEHLAGTEHRLRHTASNSEDSGKLRGFSIANSFYHGAAVSSLSEESGGQSLEITVYGEGLSAVAEPHATAGGYHSCNLDAAGKIGCVGRNDEGQLNVPLLDEGEEWARVSAGEFHTCGLVSDRVGLHSDGTIKCWGHDRFRQVADTPADSGYVALDAGPWHTCALKGDSTLRCWGRNEDGQSVSGQFDGNTFKVGEIIGGGFQETNEPARGSKPTADMGIVNWIDVPSGAAPRAVSAGGSVLGDNTDPRTSHSYTCVLWSNGEIGCAGYTWWDWEYHASRSDSGDGDKPAHELCNLGPCVYAVPTEFGILGVPDPPSGSRYTSVSVGGKHACATVSDGTIRCWGTHYHDVLGAQSDQVEVDNKVRVDPGNKDETRKLNQAVSTIAPPAGAGRWDSVSAGRHHTCATAAGAIYCWGNQRFLTAVDPDHPRPDTAGAGTPATDSARLPSAGHWHSCWVHGSDGDTRTTCMGDPDFGQSRWHNRPARDRPDKTLRLVSNLAQTTHEDALEYSASNAVAISFRSGTGAAGFELTSVAIDGADYVSRFSGVEMSIWSSHTPSSESAERPNEPVCTLRTPRQMTWFENRFDVEGICRLSNLTTYWLVIDPNRDGGFDVDRTDSDDQDSGSRSGWRIGNETVSRDREETGAWSGTDVATSTNIPQISLHGYDLAGTLSVADASAHESNDRTLDFAVTLSPAVAGEVRVRYATSDGTATAGADYTATSGTLVFAAGQTSKTIRVPIIDDNVEDDGETLTLTLSNPTGGATISDATATGTIRNTESDTPTSGLMLVGEFQDVPLTHDGSSAFEMALALSDAVAISADDLKDHAFDVAGGSIAVARRADGADHERFVLTVQPASNGPVAVSLADKADCAARGAICTSDGRMLFTQLSAVVGGPPDVSETGLPAIAGLTVKGQALTADISGITDSDGLATAVFSYQWVRATDTTQQDISGADGASYTLASDDVGKRIRVRVAYVDDAGNRHSLTSDPTGRVTEPKLGSVKLVDGTETTAVAEVALRGSRGVSVAVFVGYKPAYTDQEWQVVEAATDPATGKAAVTLDGLTEGTSYRLRASLNSGLDPFLFATFHAGRTARADDADDAEEGSVEGLPGAPGAPTVERGDGTLTVAWEPPADNGTAAVRGYLVELRSDGKTYQQGRRHVTSASKTTTTFTYLANGAAYYIRVSARNSNDVVNGSYVYGEASPETRAVPGTGPLGALGTPVLADPEYLHRTMVRLDWGDVSGADWYEVQYHHPDGNKWVTLPYGDIAIAHHGSSAVLSGLHSGHLWFVRVRSLGCGGPSPWSEIVQMSSGAESDWAGVEVPEIAEGDTRPETVGGCPPGTPVIEEPAYPDHLAVALDWADIEGAEAYEVQYNDPGTDKWVTLPHGDVTVDFDGSSAVMESLHEGYLWFFRVRAMAGGVPSSWSEIVQTCCTSASDYDTDGAESGNSAATGQPSITGTAQAGQTLTAATAGIADSDGLTNPAFSYQWVRNDGTADTDIAGATQSSYDLVDDDVGKTIKVRVTFDDDDGNPESLTSAATATVAARSNNTATGQPSITGTAQAGQTLTATTTGIADSDGLTNPAFSYQWVRNDGTADTDIAGATQSSYDLVDDDVGKTIKVRVTFDDDDGNPESLTSAATAEIAARPLTASTDNAPASHDGSTAFTFELRFSENIKMGFQKMRNHVLDVTGATITRARRLTQSSNIGWEITVDPAGNADVAITLPATTDCSAQGAVCTHGGKKLSEGLVLTVSGPGG